jgi:hypothetical protein
VPITTRRLMMHVADQIAKHMAHFIPVIQLEPKCTAENRELGIGNQASCITVRKIGFSRGASFLNQLWNIADLFEDRERVYAKLMSLACNAFFLTLDIRKEAWRDMIDCAADTEVDPYGAE